MKYKFLFVSISLRHQVQCPMDLVILYETLKLGSFFQVLVYHFFSGRSNLVQCPLDIQTSLRHQGRGRYRQRGRFIKRLDIAT